MALLSFHEYKTMPYPERCRRIGELLAKAAIRYFRQQLLARATQRIESADSTGPIDPTMLVTDKAEKEMIRHLMIAGEATPLDFCAVLNLSRPTVFRKLAHLRSAGLVKVEGRTQAARYRLRGASQEN